MLVGSPQQQLASLFHQKVQSLRDCLLNARKNIVVSAKNAEARYDTMKMGVKVYF